MPTKGRRSMHAACTGRGRTRRRSPLTASRPGSSPATSSTARTHPEHRRRQNHAVEPAVAARDGAKQRRSRPWNGRARKRRRAIRQHDLAHECFEVGVELGEVPDIAFAADRRARDPTGPGRASRGSRRRSRGCADRGRSRNISRSIRCGPEKCTPCRGGRPAAQNARSAASTPSGVFEHASDDVVGNRICRDGDEF